MSIKKLFTTALLIIALVMMLLFFAIYRLGQTNSDLIAAHIARYNSYLLADELRQSSDDLTRLARTYVVSGDPRWEQQYFEILDIRNGKKPRPAGYEKIYWDFRAAGVEPNRGVGATIPLADLMKKAGFSEVEFGKLKEAQANSDDLVNTETVAMYMVKGLFADDAGGFTRKGEPDLAKARAMMHDQNYHSFKAKIMKPVDEFLTLLDQRTQTAVDEAMYAKQFWYVALMVFAVLLSGVFVVLLILLAKRIIRPLGGEPAEMAALTQQIAHGDLTVHFSDTGRETGVYAAMRDMAMQLKDIVGNVTQATTQVSSAAAEIAQGSTELAQRTEKQAAALEETASSMEELTSTVKQSADNAGQANQLASAARTQAEQGGQVVEQAIVAMTAINQSSRRIADIISVIDEIAFQTNLLALNAAVEAARAGEQGRGFAVVAGEVRKLAQRSADAAKEIKGLITDSVSKVEDGGKLVARSGQTLKEIVTSVKKVSDIVAEMAAAAREQASGIEQVNKAILQMDQVTQQNAALVEETASASQAMGGQANELQRLMEFFTLDQSSLVANRSGAVTSTVRPNPPRPAVLPTSGLARRRSEVQPGLAMTHKPRAADPSGNAVFFKWTKGLSVGDATIDQQHQRLIEIINTLYEAMRTQTTHARLGELLERLIAYTDEHFSYEEGRLQACGYPHLVSHQRLHTELLGQVRDLQTKFNQGKRNINMELMNFLKTWLTEHIQKIDKRFSPYLTGDA